MVLLALLVPVLFAMGAIVIDLGNLHIHKRHLQTQVDAAVFAAAPTFVGCHSRSHNGNRRHSAACPGVRSDHASTGFQSFASPTGTTNRQLQETKRRPSRAHSADVLESIEWDHAWNQRLWDSTTQ